MNIHEEKGLTILNPIRSDSSDDHHGAMPHILIHLFHLIYTNGVKVSVSCF